MRHDINITVLANAVGIPTTLSGVMGMVIQGVAVANQLVLDTPYLLTSADDMAGLGITAAYDTTNATAVYQQISEFYAQAGEGALLWLQVCATATAFATYVASNTFTNFVRYTAQAAITQQAKIIGLCYQPPTAVQSATDFPADVPATVIAAQTVQKQLYAIGYPLAFIVDGYNMSSTTTPANLGTQATGTSYAVSLCITGTKGNGVSAVGLALGRYARISVGRGVGAVEDGAIDTLTAWLTNGIALNPTQALIVGDNYTVQGGAVTYNGVTYQVGQTFLTVAGHTSFTSTTGGFVVFNSTPIGQVGGTILGMSQGDLDSLGDKQYFFITTVQGISGLFWNDGSTCTAASNFFSSMEYNRVMNLVTYNARAYFTLLRGLNLPSDVQTGALDASFCAAKQASFYKLYIGPLSANSGSGDISDGSLTVTGPTYAADGNLKFKVKLVRATILGSVTGEMEFDVTL